MPSFRSAVQYLLAPFLAISSVVSLAAQSPEPRLRERISDNARLPLHGSRSPFADAGTDLGPVSPEKTLSGIAIVFKRSAAQQTDLDALLSAQQDKESPRYHRWLTATDFAARFGVADADLAATQAWLKAHGFTVDTVPPSRDRILFTGSASQIKSAFGAELHSYDLNGEHHFGPATDLSVPAALAPVTAAVLHLSDLRPKPKSRPLPAFTDAATGTHFLTPADLAIMYDLNPAGAAPLIGTGQSIAIVGESYVDPNLSGLQTFDRLAHGYMNPFLVLVPGSGVEATPPGALAEAELDLEYAGATAPDAQLYLVFTGDQANLNVYDALAYSIQQNIAPVVSISFDTCELLVDSSSIGSINALFQQAAAQGQTLVAASGDSGSTDCAHFTSPSLSSAQKQALAVGFPGSSPYVTAVGGTQLAPGTFGAGQNQFWSTFSTLQDTSLLSYVPEVAWNEGSPSYGILGGGGGASYVFPRPAWQTALPSVPAGTTRLTPDIALQASTMSPGFVLCTNDIEFVGYSRADSCSTDDLLNSTGRYIVGGGTSFAAPVFAGAVALLNQYEQEQGQGALNATLYQLAANPSTYAAAFHDVISGSTACVFGASGCTPAGQSGYSAGVGFDEATGLGSLDFAQLRAAWPANPAHSSAMQNSFLLCGSYGDHGTSIFSAGLAAQISCTIRPYDVNGTLQTGTVTLFVDQVPLGDGSPIPLPPGPAPSFTAAFTAPSQTGSHLLRVSYSGDELHLPLTLLYPFVVGSVQASGTFTLAAPSTTVVSNGSSAVPVTVTPGSTNGYHGVLYWQLSAVQISGTSSPKICYNISPVRVSGTTTAQLMLGAGTACEAPLPSGSPAMRLLPGTHTAASQAVSSKTGFGVYAALFGLGLGSFGCRRRLRSRLTSLICLFLIVSLPLLGGCGGSKSPVPTTGGSGTTGASGASGATGSNGGSGSAPTAQPTILAFTLSGSDSVNASVTATTSFNVTIN